MNDIKNSEISYHIQKKYKSDKDRNIMIDRFIKGLTYNEILKKTYSHFEELPDLTKMRLEKDLRNKCKRFSLYLMKEVIK